MPRSAEDEADSAEHLQWLQDMYTVFGFDTRIYLMVHECKYPPRGDAEGVPMHRSRNTVYRCTITSYSLVHVMIK